MAKALKADLINDAYSQMRISGLTVQPTPNNIQLALERLEGMAAELETRTICVNYNFTEEPDPADESGIELAYRVAFSSNLALRLVDFGKDVPPSLLALASQTMSNMSAQTFPLRETQYPQRMPIGSGNTLRTRLWQRFYQPVAQAPIDCDSHPMRLTNINDFSESWEEYLEEGEIISSFSTVVTDGIRLSNTVVDDPFITFRIEATLTGFQKLTFTITTSDGRVNVRDVFFQIAQ